MVFDENVIDTVPDRDLATRRAERLLTDSLAATTRRERRQQQRLAGVVQDEALRALTFALTDEVLRFGSQRRSAARLRTIVRDVGVPRSLGLLDRLSLRIGSTLAPVMPWAVMPLVRSRIVRESNGVVLSADDPAFAGHLAKRARDGFRVNVNVLGGNPQRCRS